MQKRSLWAQNAPETIRWPGSALTRWGSSQRSPDSLAAGLRGWGPGKEREGERGEGKGEGGIKEEDVSEGRKGRGWEWGKGGRKGEGKEKGKGEVLPRLK